MQQVVIDRVEFQELESRLPSGILPFMAYSGYVLIARIIYRKTNYSYNPISFKPSIDSLVTAGSGLAGLL